MSRMRRRASAHPSHRCTVGPRWLRRHGPPEPSLQWIGCATELMRSPACQAAPAHVFPKPRLASERTDRTKGIRLVLIFLSSLPWRIRKSFCGFTAAPHATANSGVSVPIILRVKEHHCLLYNTSSLCLAKRVAVLSEHDSLVTGVDIEVLCVDVCSMDCLLVLLPAQHCVSLEWLNMALQC